MPLNENSSLNRIAVLLKSHHLRVTEARRAILRIFMTSETSITHRDLVLRLNLSCTAAHRASIYRNLLILKNADLIHEIELDRYVIGKMDNKTKSRRMFLYCTVCHKHLEIEDGPISRIIREQIDRFDFLRTKNLLSIRGTCESCSPK